MERLFNDVIGKYKRIDVLINNAGITSKCAFEDESIQRSAQVVGVNFTAVAICTQYAVKQMLKQKSGGSIVNISSMSGIIPFTLDPVYTGTKFAVVGFTQSLKYLHKRNIKVNAVCPFFFKTQLLNSDDPKFHKVVSKLPFIEIDQVVKGVDEAINHEQAGICIAITPMGNFEIPATTIQSLQSKL